MAWALPPTWRCGPSNHLGELHDLRIEVRKPERGHAGDPAPGG